MTMKRVKVISATSLLATLGAVSIGCGEMEVDETVTSALIGQSPQAFRSNTGRLAVATAPGVASDSNVIMKPFSIPSQVTPGNGSWVIGFQRASDAHFLVDSFVAPNSHTVQDSRLVMFTYGGSFSKPFGTSPSLAVCAGCSNWAWAAAGANGRLWIGEGGSPFTGFDTGIGVRSGSSPSIAIDVGGKVIMAIHGNNERLWVGLNGAHGGVVDTGRLMWGSTSPSIAANGGTRAVAFHASNGHLWFGTDPFNTSDTGCDLPDGASPSLAVRHDGTPVVAFRSSTGFLGTFTPVDGCVLHMQGVWSGNPQIMASPSNPFVTQISFKQSPGQHLWLEVGGTAEDQLVFMGDN
jgi:hypothetical protein